MDTIHRRSLDPAGGVFLQDSKNRIGRFPKRKRMMKQKALGVGFPYPGPFLFLHWNFLKNYRILCNEGFYFDTRWVKIDLKNKKEVIPMEDSQIVALYLNRDERALTETAHKYASYCHSIAYRILGNRSDAEEVVNDAYMGAWKSIPPNRPLSFSAYIGKITRSLALAKWRNSRTAKRGGGQTALALEELAECIPDKGNVEQQLEMKELTACMNRFVRSLPETEQKVFILRYWHLYSIGEIAKRFHFSESKVKSMLCRTRRKLCKDLKKEELL